MGKSASPHRFGVVLFDRILVAIGERGRDSARILGQALADMVAEPVAHSFEAARAAGAKLLDRPQRPPDPADLPEPGVAREIVAARQRHRRRRREPRAQAHGRSLADVLGRALLLDRHSHPWRQLRIDRRQRQPDIALGDQALDPLDARVEGGDERPIQPRRCHPNRAPPHQRAAQHQREREPASGALRSAAAHSETGESDPAADCQQRHPLRRRIEHEPGGDAGSEPDHEPRRKLRALALEEGFHPLPTNA